MLADAKDDIANSIPDYPVIGTNMASPALSLQPCFVLNDLLYRRKLVEEDWIGRGHGADVVA